MDLHMRHSFRESSARSDKERGGRGREEGGNVFGQRPAVD